MTAMARNGVDFGIRLSAAPATPGSRRRSACPDGLYFPGYGPDDANPDLGDSAITETFGIGGFAMAAAPAIVRFVGGSAGRRARATPARWSGSRSPATRRTPCRRSASRARRPGSTLRRVVETGIAPVINTGIAHREPGVGQIGAGHRPRAAGLLRRRARGPWPPSSASPARRRHDVTPTTVLIAIGGNALILDGQRGTIAEQYENARETARHIARARRRRAGASSSPTATARRSASSSCARSWSPMTRRSRGSSSTCRSPTRRAASATSSATRCSTSSAGVGLRDRVACVLTQTVVDPADPAFARPDQADRAVLHAEEPDDQRRRATAGRWSRTPDAAIAGSWPRRGPAGSWKPRHRDAGRRRLRRDRGRRRRRSRSSRRRPATTEGVEAVIDKDLASALLAASLGVPLLRALDRRGAGRGPTSASRTSGGSTG